MLWYNCFNYTQPIHNQLDLTTVGMQLNRRRESWRTLSGRSLACSVASLHRCIVRRTSWPGLHRCAHLTDTSAHLPSSWYILQQSYSRFHLGVGDVPVVHNYWTSLYQNTQQDGLFIHCVYTFLGLYLQCQIRDS